MMAEGDETGGNPVRRHACNSVATMQCSPRCGARTRKGGACKSAAMRNGRCRMHGGASPGAPKGERNGMYRHGRRTNEAIAIRRETAEQIRRIRELLRTLDLDGPDSL
jgi:hypothetical protein